MRLRKKERGEKENFVFFFCRVNAEYNKDKNNKKTHLFVSIFDFIFIFEFN
jgi:hypothetical protein